MKLCQYQVVLSPSTSGSQHLQWHAVLAQFDVDVSVFNDQSAYLNLAFQKLRLLTFSLGKSISLPTQQLAKLF